MSDLIQEVQDKKNEVADLPFWETDYSHVPGFMPASLEAQNKMEAVIAAGPAAFQEYLNRSHTKAWQVTDPNDVFPCHEEQVPRDPQEQDGLNNSNY